MTKVLSLSADSMPFKETGFSRIRSYEKHRCDLAAEGYACEDGQRLYDHNNSRRRGGCLFQYTFFGEGRFQVLPDGRPQAITSGTGFLIPFPSPTRYWLAKGCAWEFCYVIFDGDMAYDLVKSLVKKHGYVWHLPMDNPTIALMRGLHRSVLDGRIPDEFESAATGHQILMELFRSRQDPRHQASPAVDKASRLMEREYKNSALSMDRIAAAAGYSRYHFTRLFRKETGINPHAYMQRYRIRRAMELIASTDQPVKQVAAESGFSDCAYFCKEFKRWTHHTPSEVRKLGVSLNLSEIHVG